jgi:hypothetical protein
MEQHGFHAAFQACDGLGYGGLRQPELSGGSGKRAGFRHLRKDRPRFEIWQFLHGNPKKSSIASMPSILYASLRTTTFVA